MIDNHSSKRNINLVIGLGKSGFWAAKYLRSINKRVIVWESKDGIDFLERKTALEELNIIVSLNKELEIAKYAIFSLGSIWNDNSFEQLSKLENEIKDPSLLKCIKNQKVISNQFLINK